MDKAKLKVILDNHKRWLGGEGGERADLRSADLSYANLSCANLSGADLAGSRLSWAVGNMEEIKALFPEVWPVTYTAEHLHIGCERHLISEWWGFDDERIARMDSKALAWWKKWKAYIQQTIELSPATPTGNKESEAAA